MTRQSIRVRRRPGDILLGLGALFALMVGLVGLPAGLLALGADPIPDRVPDLSELWHRVIEPDDGSLLLAVLTGSAWVCWVIFAILVAVETAGVIRGHVPHRLPGLGGTQATIGALLTTALALLPATSRAPVADVPPALVAQLDTTAPRPSTGVSPADTGSANQVPVPRALAAPPLAATTTTHSYTVRHGDTLWDLAETHLGDPTRWRDIHAVNPGIDPHRLTPGQVIAIPDPPPTADPASAEPESITVTPGDTLWDLAADHLGDSDRYVDLFDVNQGVTQADGRELTDPGLIYPGWEIILPETTTTNPGSAPDAPTDPAPPGDLGPPTSPDTPPPGPPELPESTPTDSAVPPGGPTPPADSGAPSTTPTTRAPAPATPTPAPTTTAPPTSSAPGDVPDTDVDHRVRLPSGGVVGLGLAGAVSSLLLIHRLRRRARRRPGDPSRPVTDPPDPAESPTALELEHAWHRASDRDEDEGLWWAGHDHPDHATDGGVDAEPVVRDAITAGGIGLTGPGVTPATRGLLTGLLTGTGPLGLRVVTTVEVATGLLGEHADVLDGVPGVEVDVSIPAALITAEAELIHRSRVLYETNTVTLAEAQEAVPGEPLEPLLLLLPAPTEPHLTGRLAAILRVGVDRGLGALLLGDWPTGLTCHIDLDGSIIAGTNHPGPLATGQRLDLLDAQEAADLLGGLLAESRRVLDITDLDQLRHPTRPVVVPDAPATRSPVDPAPTTETAEPVDDAIPDQPPEENEPQPVGTALIGVLGPFRILVDGQDVTGRAKARAKVRDLLAYLACHPEGVTRDRIIDAFWPGTPPDRAGRRLRQTLTEARAVLREVTGRPHPADPIPLIAGRHRLDADSALGDYAQFTAALDEYARLPKADQDARVSALERAIGLCVGDVLDEITGAWVEPIRATITSQTVDALVTLAELVEPDRPDKAIDLLDRAVHLDPYNEDCYRRILRVATRAGRVDVAHRAWRDCQARLEDLDLDPSEDTAALAHRALSGTAAHRTGR